MLKGLSLALLQASLGGPGSSLPGVCTARASAVGLARDAAALSLVVYRMAEGFTGPAAAALAAPTYATSAVVTKGCGRVTFVMSLAAAMTGPMGASLASLSSAATAAQAYRTLRSRASEP